MGEREKYRPARARVRQRQTLAPSPRASPSAEGLEGRWDTGVRQTSPQQGGPRGTYFGLLLPCLKHPGEGGGRARGS